MLGYEFVEDHSAIKPLRKEYAREEEWGVDADDDDDEEKNM